LTAVRDAAQRAEQYRHDAEGLPTRAIDRLQRETQVSFE
jgi:YD repeat-containing protein